MDRDLLARMMARRSAPPDALTPAMPDMTSGWQPTPNRPFAGLGAFDWKDPAQRPRPLAMGLGISGTTRTTKPELPEDYLRLLQLLGRRRLPPAISGVGEVR